MEARATLHRSRSSSRFFAILVGASLAALFLGGAGGYTLRGLVVLTSSPTTISTAPVDQHGPNSDLTRALPSPAVVETPPYGSPAPISSPPPERDPRGFAIPI